MIKLAILASGSGTNAEAIMSYFANHENIEIGLVMTNNAGAKVIERAKKYSVPCRIFTKMDLQSQNVEEILKRYYIDFIILAGFLLKIPPSLISTFPGKIVNIHPSLLPKYGGKGMYGHHVHDAVIKNGEKESGITIHLVDEVYDNGKHLFQKSIPIEQGESASHLAERIHVLEHEFYAKVIEKFVSGLI